MIGLRFRAPSPRIDAVADETKTVRVEVKRRPDGKLPTLRLPLNTVVHIKVVRPKAHVLEIGDCCFHTDRSILLPDAAPRPDHEPGPARTPGLVLAQGVLSHAAEHPEKRLFVAGHADRAGSAQHNLTLSEARAENVQLFLSGDGAGWARHAHEHHDVDDLQRILVWVASRHPDAECHPGAVDNALGPKTQAALDALRDLVSLRFGLALATGSGPVVQDWEAIYVLYDDALAENLETSFHAVQARKQALAFNDPPFTGFGEDFPIDAPQSDGVASESNRRVDVLFLDPDEILDLGGSPRGTHVFGPESTFALIPL